MFNPSTWHSHHHQQQQQHRYNPRIAWKANGNFPNQNFPQTPPHSHPQTSSMHDIHKATSNTGRQFTVSNPPPFTPRHAPLHRRPSWSRRSEEGNRRIYRPSISIAVCWVHHLHIRALEAGAALKAVHSLNYRSRLFQLQRHFLLVWHWNSNQILLLLSFICVLLLLLLLRELPRVLSWYVAIQDTQIRNRHQHHHHHRYKQISLSSVCSTTVIVIHPERPKAGGKQRMCLKNK